MVQREIDRGGGEEGRGEWESVLRERERERERERV